MEFLQQMKPLVNFEQKRVSILHAHKRYWLPTCVVGQDGRCVTDVAQRGSADVSKQFSEVSECRQGPDGVLSCDFSGQRVVDTPEKRSNVLQCCSSDSMMCKNSFYGLEVEEAAPSVAENCPCSDRLCKVSSVSEESSARAKRDSKRFRQCLQCGSEFVGRDDYCQQCNDDVFTHDREADLKVVEKLVDFELLTLKTFVKRGKRGEFDFVGLLQFDGDDKFDGQLNFTHRAAHGAGEDADAKSAATGGLAAEVMVKLKTKYPEVFSEPQYPVDRSKCPQVFEHKIPLVDEHAPPPKRKLYPLDTRELEELKKQLQTFLESGRIEVSNGAYGAPILFAKKKDGGLRMCIDYRALNSQTKLDVYPLPRLDELMQRLDGAVIFSKFDMRDGYHQVPMFAADKVKTAFTCRYGTFQFTVMPFGLSSAPATFQRMMNNIFFELLDEGVVCYLDDLLVYSRSVDDHVQLLDRVFGLLAKHKLYLKESKCSLFLDRVNFLGHVVSAQGVSMESGKVDAVRAWPVPKTVTHVQQFLGLCNYYRRFILRFSEIASPLTLLTRKDQKFEWGQTQQHAFDTLKRMLCSAPVLKIFDSRLHTRVVCDASNYCVGGVLEQQVVSTGRWHPVEYYSKRLSSSERNYSATDREYVAIRQCLERWRHFLVGKKFVILTDHVALTYIQKSASVSRRNARWLEFLSQFNFEIEHIRGRENVVADALSRVPGSEALDSVQLCSSCYSLGVEHVDEVGDDCVVVDDQLFGVISVFENSSFLRQLQLEQEQSSNVWFLERVKQAKGGSTTFVFRNQVLCKLVKDTFCPIVPDSTSSTVDVILGDLHAAALGGHLGYRKLLKQVQCRFYWQNMCKTVEAFLKKCSVCQQNKHSTQKPVGLLHPVENPTKPFEHVTMDFIVALPRSTRGYDAIFSIIDRFSRVCRFIPCHTSLTALEAAQIFFEHWVCRFGVPKKIISDRDVKFTSQFWQELFRLLGCRVALSSAYHPQTDGLTERFHRTIEQTLRCYCSGQQQQWCKLLSQCEFALNSSFQSAVQDTPFKVVHGFNPTIPLDVQLGGVQLPAVSDFVLSRQAVQKCVLDSLAESAQRMVVSADRRRRHVDLQVGQQVWLSTKYLPVRGTSRKLSALWAGPFLVVGQVNDVAFRLELPSDWRIHDVFHVSQLKAVVGSVQVEQSIQVDGQDEYEISHIVDSRVVRGVKSYLVSWKGYGDFENSWVLAKDMGNAQELVAAYERGLQVSGKPPARGGSGVRQ